MVDNSLIIFVCQTRLQFAVTLGGFEENGEMPVTPLYKILLDLFSRVAFNSLLYTNI